MIGGGKEEEVKMDVWRGVSRRRWEGKYYKNWWWVKGEVVFIAPPLRVLLSSNTV